MTSLIRLRTAGLAAAVTAAPFALAWRFAHVYRARAGYPRPAPPTSDPADFGLPFEERVVPTPDGLELPAWWIPATPVARRSRRRGVAGASPVGAPAVVLVHGWESARHRTLPNALFLHALGYHVLTLDIRGHGANPTEALPVSAGEFGTDALAGVRAALAEPMVTQVAVLGHSMGSIGAILAAAAEPRVAAAVLTATPADPYRLTRQTFRLARIHLPDAVAYPLAWLTTRVYLEPRGHTVDAISATGAVRQYRGPILAIHGTNDRVVPAAHLARLVEAARAARAGQLDPAPVEVLTIHEGDHSWLYEFPAYRMAVGRFLAAAFGGPLGPEAAAEVAASVDARRPSEPDHPFSALAGTPGTEERGAADSGGDPPTGEAYGTRLPAPRPGR
jgi:alpha-beta hydrolase superfamily lysophospholipase